MDITDFTREHIYKVAAESGFQRDTTEKVIRLYYVLKGISQIPLLRNNLALKGGTAINLAVFSLTRLSVDIDMDFTRSGRMDELLPVRKEIKETLFNLLQSQGYSAGTGGKETHTLDQWNFTYSSAGGNNDHIKIELNYGIRNHVLPVMEKDIRLQIVSDSGIRIPVLHPCELFATKINALLERSAVRDLFDVYTLAKSSLFSTPEEKEMLRKCIVFYQTVGVEGFPKKDVSVDGIKDISPAKIKSQLVPLLASGKKYFPMEEARLAVAEYLTSILCLSPEEREYMEAFSNLCYKPELLFRDNAILTRIANHPMALWKISQAQKEVSAIKANSQSGVKKGRRL